MIAKKFVWRWLNVLVVASLLLGMLPFEALAAVAPATGTPPESAPQAASTPQARQAEVLLYLPLVLRGYAAGALPVTLNQYAAPWLLLPGDVTTYTLVVQNPGTYPVQSGELTAEAPEAVSPVAGSISADGVYDAQARQVRWNLPELAGGAALTVTFRAQALSHAAVTLTTMARLTATLSLGHVFTDSDPTYLSVGEAQTLTLTAAGGVLTTPDGNVRLMAPAGAVTQTTPVRLASFPTPFAAGDLSTRWLFFFDVTAVGAAGELLHDADGHTRFLQPLTATISMENTWEQPFLAYMTDDTEGYPVIATEFDRTAEVLTATLQTFSKYGAGEADPYADTGTYKLMTNQPGVGMFNGAATYSYQVDAPGGRRGLTPKLSLNYGSSGMNSLLGVVQSGPVGMGWSLGGQVQIVRPVKSYETCGDKGCGTFWLSSNDFVLTINGTSYNLEGYTKDPNGGCRYAATDGPGLRVMRYTIDKYCGYSAAGAPENDTQEYWEVTTGDGTVYRLGYNQNSEQLMRMDPYNPDNCIDLEKCGDDFWLKFEGYAGELKRRVAYRWSVDEVRDIYSNTIQYGYYEEPAVLYVNSAESLPFDRAQHMEWIRYGGNKAQGMLGMYLVDLVLESRTDKNDNGGGAWFDAGPDYNDDFVERDWSMWDTLRLDRVRVCANPTDNTCNGGTLLADYDLDYEFVIEDSTERIETTRLQSITRSGQDGNGVMASLPATMFGYVSLKQEHPTQTDKGYDLTYPRLQTVDNGYGGVTTFTYEPVSQAYNDHIYTSYRVLSQSVSDGLGHTSAMQYAYNDFCFNFGAGHYWSCNYPGAEPDFGLTGHRVVTQTVTGYAGELLAQTVHHFHKQFNEEWRMGREWATIALDAAGVGLQQTQTQWVVTDTVDAATFTYAAAVTSTDYTGATPLTTWKKYEYNPKQQGGKQLGLLTHVSEYDSQNVRQRLTQTNYVVNENAWLMVPWANSVFGGSWERQAMTFYLYDNNTDPDSQVLDKGILRLERNLLVNTTPCSTTFDTVDTVYKYDVYGSPMTTTTYSGYGTIGCAPGAGGTDWYTDGGPGGIGSEQRTSAVTYDDNYHLFPKETCTAVGTPQEQCAYVEYYGVNADSERCKPEGSFFGAVCREWGPNGDDTATHYHYDAFGRKTETWRPGEAPTGQPGQKIQYSDITDPGRRPTMVAVWDRYADAGSFYSETTTIWQRVFYDGLGRTVQRHSRDAEWTTAGGGKDIVQYSLYDGLGRVVSQSVPYLTERYTPIPGVPNNPYKAPDLSQAQTYTEYDMLGRVVRLVEPDGETAATTQYAGRTTTVVDANGHQMRQTVDDLGRMMLVEEFTGTAGSATVYATTSYAYDAVDNLTAVTDTVGNVTTMSYDALGRKLAMNDPDMGAWSYTYNPAGSLMQQTDNRGCVTEFAYDDLERLVGKSYSGAAGCTQPAAGYTYDEGGATQYAIGQRTGMTYAGGATTYAYDWRGRLVRATQVFSGTSLTTAYTYDELDRPVSVTYPDGEVVTTTYNTIGYPATLTGQGATDYVSAMRYTELGTPSEMVLGNGTVTRWGYKGLDGPWDRTTKDLYYKYGSLWRSRVSTSAGAPLFDQVFNYDPVGNVDSIWEPPTVAAGWPAITQTAGFTDTFATWKLNAWVTTTSHSLVSLPGHDGAVLRNSGSGNPPATLLSRPGYPLASGKGMEVRFRVDNTDSGAQFMLLSNQTPTVFFGVVVEDGKLVAQYMDSYEANVSRNPAVLLPVLEANQWYVLRLVVDDGRGLYAEVYKDADGYRDKRSSYGMWLDPGLNWRFQQTVLNGNVYLDEYFEFATTGMSWSGDQAMDFTYDPLNRLTGVTPQVGSPSYSASYRYDHIGNLTYKREGSVPGVTYTYPALAAARPHAVTALSNGSNFTYDDNGNMTQRVEISGAEHITYTQGYDAENRLVVVTRTAGLSNTVTHFRYDGDGARIAQITDEGATLYAGDLYEEFHEAGTAVVTATQYYYLGSQRVAMRKGTDLLYLHSDYLGSASLTTDAAGEVVSKQRYYPFGGVREQEGESPTDFGFTGQRLDDSTGLMYYRARYYSARLGRFVSADMVVQNPKNPQSFNRYAYVLNNPLLFVDPTGYFASPLDENDNLIEDAELTQYFLDLGYSDADVEDLFQRWKAYHAEWWNILLEAQYGDYLDGRDIGFSNNLIVLVGVFYKSPEGKLRFDWTRAGQDTLTPDKSLQAVVGWDPNSSRPFTVYGYENRYHTGHDLADFWAGNEDRYEPGVTPLTFDIILSRPGYGGEGFGFIAGTGMYENGPSLWSFEILTDLVEPGNPAEDLFEALNVVGRIYAQIRLESYTHN